MVGAIGFFYPETMSLGYGYAQKAIDGTLPLKILLVLCFGKILTTSITLPSGGSGGSFGPSVVIGAALGGAYGYILWQFFPAYMSDPANYVMVGMCGIVTATSKTPIAALIMVSEMTGGYNLLVPTALVSALAYLFSEKVSIYEEQVKARVDSPATNLPERPPSIKATSEGSNLTPVRSKCLRISSMSPFKSKNPSSAPLP